MPARKARVEGAKAETAKPAPKATKATGGTEHARNLEAALAFYEAEYPDEFADERNVPFAGHIATVAARLRNK